MLLEGQTLELVCFSLHHYWHTSNLMKCQQLFLFLDGVTPSGDGSYSVFYSVLQAC